MKVGKIIKICAVSLMGAALITVSVLLYFRTALYKVQYAVYVEDELYDYMVSENALSLAEKYNFTSSGLRIVKESEKDSHTLKFSGNSLMVAAYVSVIEDSKLSQMHLSMGQKSYLLSSHSMLPVISAPFDVSDKTPLLDPELTISFADSTDIPEGTRALPVDGAYLGDEEYSFKVQKYAVSTVFIKEFEDQINDFLSDFFLSVNLSEADESECPVFITSVGDIMLARGTQELLMSEADEDGITGIQKVFKDTLPILQGSDFTIGNLEGVLTESTANAIKTYTFKFKKEVLPYLQQAGFDYLMQTNNHCYDYGEKGFKDTLKAFEEYNIPSSGIGKNNTEALKFYHFECKGQKFAVISCGAYPVEQSGFNGKTTATATATRAGILWEGQELLNKITEEKNLGYSVIVNVHGGQEYQFKPTASQRSLYESFIDAGALIVFGSHPHVLQNTEWYNDGLIVYSLGNYIFKGMQEMYRAEETELVKIGVVQGKICYVEQYPAKISGSTVSLVK